MISLSDYITESLTCEGKSKTKFADLKVGDKYWVIDFKENSTEEFILAEPIEKDKSGKWYNLVGKKFGENKCCTDRVLSLQKSVDNSWTWDSRAFVIADKTLADNHDYFEIEKVNRRK